ARAVLLDDLVESSPIEDVRPFERPPFGSPPVPRRQIVESDGLIPLMRQDLAGVRADIAGPSCNQDSFRGSATHPILVLKAKRSIPLPSAAPPAGFGSSWT